MKKSLPFIISFLFLSVTLFAQENEVEIKTVKLTESIYALYGQGGNMGLCIGEDGAFLIDDQFAPLTEKIKAAIAELTDHPVKFVVNTHWHGDHTGGNENFAKEGALVVAHENVRERLSKDQFIEAFNATVEAAPKGSWPVITFSKDMTIHFNGEKIMLIHHHSAHTDGDAMVYFTNSNVLHMGDILFNGLYPYLDIATGGTIKGYLAAVDAAIMMVDDETKIIPGHGEIATKADLITYKKTLSTIAKRIAEAINAGQSLEEVLAAGVTKEYDADWEWSFINSEKIVTAIYTDLSSGEK